MSNDKIMKVKNKIFVSWVAFLVGALCLPAYGTDMCTIQGSNGACKVQAFIGAEFSVDPDSRTCRKLKGATYQGACVNGVVQGLVLISRPSESMYYFSDFRAGIPNELGIHYSPVLIGVSYGGRYSTGCVYFGRNGSKIQPWDKRALKTECLRAKQKYGDEMMSDATFQSILQGRFVLSAVTSSAEISNGDTIMSSKEFDSLGSLLSKSLDIYELYKKADTIIEMFKYARNLNTLDELEVSLSRFKLLGSGLSKKDISIIRGSLEANLLPEAGSIFAHFLLNKQYDYWESQGIDIFVPRNIAESSMDTLINVASANLPGQLKDQTIAITEAYLDMRAQKTDYINSAIAYASTYVNALSGRERNYRSLIEGMIVTNKSYLEDVAKKSIWISDFDSEAKINIINGLIKVRAFQVSSLTFGEDLASIKMLAETYDKFNWGSGDKYQKFADEVARSLNVSQSTTSSSVSSAPRIGNIIDTRVIGSGNGCSCTFELTNSDVSAGLNQSIFFGADYRMTDGKAWMNINGSDIELLPLNSINITSNENDLIRPMSPVYTSNGITASIEYRQMNFCPPEPTECEVNRFDITVTVVTGGLQKTVKGNGSCGC